MNVPQKIDVDKIKSSSDEGQIDFIAISNTLWREKFWIILISAACIFLGGIYAYFVAVPKYQASAVVMMESRETEVIGLDSVLGGLSSETSVVKTEVEVLRGRTLMGRVVDDLALVKDPEFNGALRPKGIVARFKETLLGSAPSQPDPKRRRDSVVSALLNRVTITNIPQSLVFRIGVESESSVKSAAIADAIARLYINDQIRVKFEATEKAAEWLAGQAAELKTELERAEEQIRRFQSDTSVISAETLAAMDRQLKDTRERRAAIEAQLGAIASQRQVLAATTSPYSQSAALGDPQLIDLAAAAERGGEGALAAFTARRDLLERQMGQDALRLRSQADALAIVERSLAADIEKQSQELIRLEQLIREAEASKLLYEHFQTRLKEAVAQQGIQQADSRVLSEAVIPGGPSAPRKPLILAMTGVLGLLLGCVLVLLREMTASGIRTANDLEILSGRVVLGQIPQMPKRQRSTLLPYLAQNPTSAAAEAVRNLRTSILLSDIDKTPQVIGLTSAVPGEGKTTLTLALAQNLTMMGKRVLVIEGDIRRRTFKRHLNLPLEQGLVTAMSGAAPLAEVVQHAEGLGDVLLGEKAAVNAADLFASEAFARLLAEARKSYDFILVDTPPVLVVPDARVIAQSVDAMVFIVHWDRTSGTQVQEGLRMIASVNVRVAGVVLSQIDPRGMRRYGYGERYGAYAAYGNKYYTAG